jgi:hypothetical protein
VLARSFQDFYPCTFKLSGICIRRSIRILHSMAPSQCESILDFRSKNLMVKRVFSFLVFFHSFCFEMSHRPYRQDERRQSHLCSQQDNNRGFIQNERDRPSFRSQHGRLTSGNDEQGRRRSRSCDSEVGSQHELWRDGSSYTIQTRPADFATSAAAGYGTHCTNH